MADTDAYKRLAEEYQKVKQHNAILKKAFREEQEKTTKLDGDIKAVESRLRAVTEESDSLGFNNARLTKRVAVLQEALEEEKARSAGSSGWFGSGAKQELGKVQQQLKVLQDELEVKIRENEELHMRIFETGQETGTIKEDLQDRIAKLRAEVKSKTEELEDLAQSNKHTVARLTSDNTTLQARSDELSDTLARTKSLMQQREHTMTQAQQQLSSQLESATSIITKKLPFNDTENEVFNRLNLPTHDHTTVAKRAAIAFSGITLFKKFIGFWKEWCDAEHEKLLYINRFSSDTPDALKQTNRKLGALFAEFPEVWSSLVSSFSIFMASQSLSTESETSKQDTLLHLQRFVTLHERTTLELKPRLDSESTHVKMFANNESARSYNTALIENWTRSQSQLETFSSYFSIFCGATALTHDSSSPAVSNALFALKKSFEAIANLKTLLKERSSITQQLVNIETQADAFLSNDVKVINNRRVTALSNASAMFDKICELIHDYIASLESTPNTTIRSAQVSFPDGLFALEPMTARSRSYLQQLRSSSNLPQSPSIPYVDQIRHVEQIGELTSAIKSKEIDIAALRQQLVQHASAADKIGQELKATREALQAKSASLQEAMAEITEIKQQLAIHQANAAQLGFTPPSTIHSADNASPRVTGGYSNGTQLSNTGALEPQPTSSDSISTTTFEPPTYASFLSTQPSESTSSTSAPTVADSTILPSYSASDLLADFGVVSTTTPSTTAATEPTSQGLPANSSREAPSPGPSSSKSQTWSMVVTTDGVTSHSLELGDIDRDREEQMKRYYEQRVQQFQSKVDATDRKYVELYQQTMDVEKRLKDTVTQREGLRMELDAAEKKRQSGVDELETTRANYDQQLKMLTEHMVSLSDKISAYEEQLSALKNSTVRCGKCKAWNTIEWLMGEGKMGQRCSHGNHPSSFNYA